MSFEIKYLRSVQDAEYKRDWLEKTGDVCMAGLRVSCGKIIKVSFKKQDINSLHCTETKYNLIQKITAIFLCLLVLPIAMPTTIVGALAYSVSGSRKKIHKVIKEYPLQTKKKRETEKEIETSSESHDKTSTSSVELDKKKGNQNEDINANKSIQPYKKLTGFETKRKKSGSNGLNEKKFKRELDVEDYIPDERKKNYKRVLNTGQFNTFSCTVNSKEKSTTSIKDCLDFQQIINFLDIKEIDSKNKLDFFLKKYRNYTIDIDGIETKIEDIEINKNNKINKEAREQILNLIK